MEHEMEKDFPIMTTPGSTNLCKICFCKYEDGEGKLTIACGHSFCSRHSDTISKRQKCPICRKHVPSGSLFRLREKITSCDITTEEDSSYTCVSSEPSEKKRRVKFVTNSPETETDSKIAFCFSNIDLVTSSSTSSSTSLEVTSLSTSLEVTSSSNTEVVFFKKRKRS